MISVQQWTKWMSKGNISLPQLLLENYKKLTLSDVEMMLVIQLHSFLSEGHHFPSVEQLQERMSCSKLEICDMLNRLRKNKYIDIRSSFNDEGKVIEIYSLDPMWEKLIRYMTIEMEKVGSSQNRQVIWPADGFEDSSIENTSKSADEGEVFKRFEQEFGRPLSPMECETINIWLDEDGMSIALIFLALKESVVSNKLSLRYIDKILFEWQKNGYKTADDIQEHTQKLRNKQLTKLKPATKSDEVTFSFYNWLER